MSKYYKTEDVIYAFELLKKAAREIHIDIPVVEGEEDCISREWVLEKLKEWENSRAFPTESSKSVIKFIANEIHNAPPSVMPSRVEAWWINDTRYNGWTCSNCNYHDGNATDKFCSDCGAKMKGKKECVSGI